MQETIASGTDTSKFGPTSMNGLRGYSEIARHYRRQPYLLREHIAYLRRYARALVRDRDAADDLVEDTLERASQQRPPPRPARDMRTWLFAILHNEFVDRAPQQEREAALDSNSLPGGEVMPAQSEGAALALFETALHAIPADQREVLLLVALEQMTYEEIAETLSIPLAYVVLQLSRARDGLRRLDRDAT